MNLRIGSMKGLGIGAVGVRKACEEAYARGLRLLPSHGRVREALLPFAEAIPSSHQAGFKGRRAVVRVRPWAPEALIAFVKALAKADPKLTAEELKALIKKGTP